VIRKGKRVSIAYELVVEGRLIQSIGAQKPMRYVHGQKQILGRLEKALRGLAIGDRKEVSLSARDGYGPVQDKYIVEIPRSSVPRRCHYVGQRIKFRKSNTPATIREVRPVTLILDLNHPLAGKRLHFSVLIVGVDEKKVERTRLSGPKFF